MIRVPSIIRLPKYKSFEYIPRHYDPVKEEIEERTRRLRQEIIEEEHEYVSNLAGAFRKKSDYSSMGSKYSAGVLQLFIAALLLGTFTGYLFYGNKIFYILLLAAPVYLYFRIRGILAKRSHK